jgi:ElaB/YqjD/DUF883 family membrane-anchored ribosome-binding protein
VSSLDLRHYRSKAAEHDDFSLTEHPRARRTAMSSTSEASQKLVANLKTLATDTQDLIKATAEQSGEKIAVAREKARAGLAQAQANIAAAQTAVTERAKAAAQTADGYVHDHPWTTVGVVALFAFTIGFMAGRR